MIPIFILIVLAIASLVLTAIGVMTDKDILLEVAMILILMILLSVLIGLGIAVGKKV